MAAVQTSIGRFVGDKRATPGGYPVSTMHRLYRSGIQRFLQQRADVTRASHLEFANSDQSREESNVKWDVGLLGTSASCQLRLGWIRRGHWLHPHFPEDIRHELSVLLATPGFSDTWLIHNLRTNNDQFYKARRLLANFHDLSKEVEENWLSISRDDAVQLSIMRPAKRSPIPLVSQLRIIDDLKAGRTQTSLAREFWTSVGTVHQLGSGRLLKQRRWRKPLPPGFSLLVGV